MIALEQLIVEFLLNFVPREALNAFFSDPQTVATLLGCLIAVSGALLGTFLLQRLELHIQPREGRLEHPAVRGEPRSRVA